MDGLRRYAKWLWIPLAVAVVVLVWTWVRGRTSVSGTFTQVVAVERGTLVATITLTGQAASERRASLSFDVNRLPLLELKVTAGDTVRQGDVLAVIDASTLERAEEQAAADLLSAQEALDKARDPYTDLERQKAEWDVASAEIALAEAKLAWQDVQGGGALASAERDLRSAQISLTQVQHSTAVGKAVRDLEYTVAWHERKLRSLQAELSQGRGDATAVAEQEATLAHLQAQLASARTAAETSLTAAEDKVAQAEQAVAKARGGADSVAVVQARTKVQQAEYNLAKAQEALARVLAGPDAKTVQLAQAKLDAAQATWEAARTSLTNATMVAPFDGTVLSVGAQAGDLVSSSTNVVVLADLTKLRVTASVAETDISKVSVGQEATITFDAFAGQRFTGKVLEVPLEGQVTQNVVRYSVPLSLDGAEGVGLRSGMTANVSLVVGRTQNALLVPALAVLDSDDGTVVLVPDETGSGRVATRVQVGLSDGTYVEVVRGLNEGDRVVVEYATATTQTSGFGGLGIGGMGAGAVNIREGIPGQIQPPSGR